MISYSDHSHSLISSSPPTAATTTYLLLKSFKGCPLSWIYGQTSSHYFHTLLLGGAFQVVSVWKQGQESRTLKCLKIYRFCPLLVPIWRPTKSNPLISSCFSFSVWAPSLLGQLRYFFAPNLVLVTLSDERSHANLSPSQLFANDSRLFPWSPIAANCQLSTIVHNSPHWSTKGTFLLGLSLLIVNISNPPQFLSPSKELVPVFGPNDDASPTSLC